MKLVTFDDIDKLGISPQACMDWVTDTIARKDEMVLPPKISLSPREGSFMNTMPCLVSADDGRMWGGVKLVTRFPGKIPALDSKLILLDTVSGEMVAFMDADWITAMRTGAVAAHSVNLFAKQDYAKVSIMGLGNTARATLLMLLASNPDRELDIRLLRHKGQEELFAKRFARCGQTRFSPVGSYDELVSGAEVIISCVTYLADDICGDALFDEGVLIVPVHTRGFSNCDLFFDKIFADDYGHVHHFKNFSRFRSFAEVSDVVNGRAPGRESDRERILAYNIGLSIHDVVFAARIWGMLDARKLPDLDMKQPVEKFWV